MEAGPVPVAVDVAGPVRSQVLRVVEGVLGWQVVAPDDPVLPPRCVLVDPARAPAHGHGPVPVVVVITAEDDPATAARAGRHATEVLDGVPDAEGLRRLVTGLDRTAPAGRPAWCTVATAAGGVGATTVATALAGLRAWRHGPTLLATTGPSHQAGAPTITAGDLASPAAWAAATPAVGIDRLRVVRLREPAPAADAGPVPLVLEVGVAEPTADVLVLRPDRAGLQAAAEGTGAVVVVGTGPVAPAELRRAAADRPVVACPWSARVAAAAAAGRLPTDVPGTWLRPLAEPVRWFEERAGAAA